ncbi:MAG TPA: gamma carbonic anhydrase family protein [Steroidobacteraceae bacterium]|jgi:carbonic anhydrase/acetyltransferase-like protein (isoleucine patch superfamily)|nr:gamma carbonic anhydrase family protein [Steroidobacteraceae bacterium]
MSPVHGLGERQLVTAGEDYYIAPGAQVIGSVQLGAAASLWFNCVVRADDELIEIGAGSNVQDGCVLHADPGEPLHIGRDCTIGHLVMLHSCTIGDETLIGNGAIVLDRARIGRHCIVAAGALVPPDHEIADGSVVMGAPAKLVRACSAADVAMIREAAEHYRARSSRYRMLLRSLG